MMAKMRGMQAQAPAVAGLQEGTTLSEKLSKLVESGDIDGAKPVLTRLKILMTSFQSLPPLCQESTTAEEERKLSRDILEAAVFLSAREPNTTTFQRHMAQLKPYYMGGLLEKLPQSPNRLSILGLNLFFLLVENRLAEFHSELELLTEEELGHECISFPIRLEQYLMVGSYDQVLEARAHIPHPYFQYLMVGLLDTVRDAIAECMGQAYKDISIGAAQELLMLKSRQEVEEFVEVSHPEWVLRGDTLLFKEGGAASKSSDIPSMRLIAENLSYATELERIV